MGLAAQVLATSRADSPALLEIIDALTVALEEQSQPVPRRESAQALFLIAHHTSLPAIEPFTMLIARFESLPCAR